MGLIFSNKSNCLLLWVLVHHDPSQLYNFNGLLLWVLIHHDPSWANLRWIRFLDLEFIANHGNMMIYHFIADECMVFINLNVAEASAI